MGTETAGSGMGQLIRGFTLQPASSGRGGGGSGGGDGLFQKGML